MKGRTKYLQTAAKLGLRDTRDQLCTPSLQDATLGMPHKFRAAVPANIQCFPQIRSGLSNQYRKVIPRHLLVQF
jgi:hypothetical protein